MQGPQERALQSFIEDLQSGELTYDDAKRRYLELGDTIQQRYEREVTAVALDVVGSRDAKTHGSALDAQLTFDAFHRWVEEKLRDYGCSDSAYTWSGDGLLAMFVRPEQAVAMGRAIIDGLPVFNAQFNRLRGRSLAVRMGVHTGPVLPSEAGNLKDTLGKIASDTLDLAGHLQKSASPNQMAISQTTYGKLNEGKGSFTAIRRALPNPGTCYAYPPSTIDAEPAPAAAGAVRPGTSRAIPWIVGGAFATIAASAVIVAMVLGPQLGLRGKAGANSQTPVVLTPQPLPGAGTRTPDAGADPPGLPSSPTAAPPGVAAPVTSAPAAPGPRTTLWRSPEADSGVPARLAPSPPEVRWLLVIGVGTYRDRGLLADGAGADARLAAPALQHAFQVPQNHTTLLADDSATAAGIRSAFQALQRAAVSGRDTVIVYLAGAAAIAADRPDLRHPNGAGFVFFPVDGTSADPAGTGIYGADIAAWLGATAAQTVLVLADTPYAGALDVPAGTDAGRQFVLLGGSGASQAAGLARGQQAGVFLETLVSGAQGNADGNGDRRVNLRELTQFVVAEGRRRTGGAQTPEVRTGFGGFVPELDLAP